MQIFVVDTETTGLDGIKYADHIVEIAICKLNTITGKIMKLYQSIVGHQSFRENAWVFQNTDLTPEMVKAGPKPEVVIGVVRNFLRDQLVTSFNTTFDFNCFLDQKPWEIEYTRQMPCIMLSATQVCQIPGYYGDYKWPRLEEAYRTLVIDTENNDPTHRAMADCYASALVLRELIKRKKYNLKN